MEHFIRHPPATAYDSAKAYTREDIDIIALSGYMDFVAKFNCVKGAAAGKDCLALAPAIGLFSRTLGLGGQDACELCNG